jgi:GntR family transcriptional regulator
MRQLEKGGPIPLYHQVKEIIRERIDAGHWKPGERIPTEDDLIASLRVSRITIRQALRDLSTLGYIRREQGRGTFVERGRRNPGSRELASFTEEMQRRRAVASSAVLERGVTHASLVLAAILKVPRAAPVFRLRRLRLANGEPLGIQTAFLSVALVPGIEEMDFDAATSLYDLLRSRYGLQAARAKETHMAVLVGTDDADRLGEPAGSPALATERIVFLADGRPLEYVQSIMRGDRYKLTLDLVNRRR